MEFAVYSAQVILVALASYLLFTIARLAKRDGLAQPLALLGPEGALANGHSRPLPRIESIAQLQMFAGALMLELRMNGLNSTHIRRKDWLFFGVCYYFLGACRALGSHYQCTETDLVDLMHFVLRRHIGLDFDEASRAINQLLLAPDQDAYDEATDAGAQAAKAWLREKRIPKEISLFNSITEWGMTI